MHIGMRALFHADNLRAQLLRGGAGSVGLKVASVALGLALAIVLARILGPSDYGVYVYVYALVSLLAIPAQFGLPALVIRETAKAEANFQWGLMRGLWRWAGLCALGMAFAIGIVSAAVAWMFVGNFSGVELTTFWWGLVLVPLLALGSLRGAALQGLRKVVRGQLPELLIRPALLVLFVLVVSVLRHGSLPPDQAMALHVLAAAAAFGFGAVLLWRERPLALAESPRPIYDARHWLMSVLPLGLIAGMWVIYTQIDVVLLGVFGTSSDVGVYRVAAQGALLVPLGLSAVGMVTMPYFARFHALGDLVRFQQVATAGARASLLFALPIALVFFVFGSLILRLVFGSAYMSGYLPLAILSAAQLVNCGFGIIWPLLEMSGFERDAAKGMVIAAVCNTVLNAIMIPHYGMTGAAIATGTTLIIQNVVMWGLVRHRLGVDSSALGIFSRRSNTTVSS